MKKEYDFSKMKFKNNPYVGKLKKSVTIRLDSDVIDYFKLLSKKTGSPYQTLVNDYLRVCKDEKMLPKSVWKKTA